MRQDEPRPLEAVQDELVIVQILRGASFHRVKCRTPAGRCSCRPGTRAGARDAQRATQPANRRCPHDFNGFPTANPPSPGAPARKICVCLQDESLGLGAFVPRSRSLASFHPPLARARRQTRSRSAGFRKALIMVLSLVAPWTSEPLMINSHPPSGNQLDCSYFRQRHSAQSAAQSTQ
jgi:hypothetical protein